MSPTEQTDLSDIFTVQEERAKFGEEKPKAKDTARLIWASKPKKEPNPKDLEFQTAEEVYPNVADIRDRKLSAYATNGKKIAERPNRLIWGDNLLVMQALLAQGYEGQIDLIYIDPPFNTGESFNFDSEVRIGNGIYEKDLPVNERLAYTDTWSRGRDSFLDMLYPRLQLMRKLLSEKGSIYVHCDWHSNSYIRLLMDEIFSREFFLNEIIWYYYNKFQGNVNRLAANHDVIFCYSKTSNYQFFHIKEKREEGTVRQIKRKWDKEKGSIVNVKGPDGKVVYQETDEKTIDDVWRISMLQPADRTQNMGFPTQKPEAILERIIKASSTESDLVADFFCGSGTTGAVAERLGRRWILSDISKTAIQVTRSRLVNQNSNPFIIENLGNYQRQLIYAKEVNLRQMYTIILKLYGAVPRTDMQGFGISREDKNTLVYVCEPDRAMTAKKAIDLARLARAADGKGYRNLVILAWDYDYDFDDTYKKLARNKEKELSVVEFKIIPSDVYKYLRSTKLGDPELAKKITFYQKPYVRISEPEIKKLDENTFGVKIRIEQFVVMDLPLKDESKRPEIEKCLAKNFAYLIDYWTVDWNYNGDVFRSEWQAIRDRHGDQPVPVVAEKTLEKGKKYVIAVRVVDVFGNDATGTKEIEIR